ncbi:MAG: HDOD domain-containing protein, partial [Proteobacteria bacterium]|nr:HDOD domain-containing protein [Pseudomonadota bacterium]MBU1612687.1 HDOD domain-containing protein [Pseudomonadota bacterium]
LVAERLVDVPSMGGFILRLVNSPCYGLVMPVESLPRAVALAGFNEVSAVALAAAVARGYRGTGSVHRDDPLHWRRSMSRGVYARRLAMAAGLPGEWFFTAGMLADIGALVAGRTVPDALDRSRQLVRRSKLASPEAETVVLGAPISEFSARLLARWEAPKRLVEMVRHCETPAITGYDPVVCVLHIAGILADVSCFGLPDTGPVGRLDPAAIHALGLRVADLQVDRLEVVREADALVRSFLAR